MKHPIDGLRKVYLELIHSDNENANKYFEHSDKFITWIIGFCVAGISLLFSNSETSELIGEPCFKFIIYLLAASAITGILYRWLSRGYSTEFYKATMNLVYSMNKGDHLQPLRDVDDLNDIETLKEALNNDFDYPADAVISAYKIVEMKDEEIMKHLKEAYAESKKWYLEQLEIASETFREMYKTVYGYSDKKIDKEKEFTSIKLKFFRGASNVLFMCSLLAFLLAFVILIIAI